PSSRPLNPDPQTKPSNQTLKKCHNLKGQPLTTDPQKLWQTLKNFGYPLFKEFIKRNLIIKWCRVKAHALMPICHKAMI
ncbi:MAG: hypothetical protein IKH28_05675, partial [Lachnospiraceae bacterium]|nr:hypothetical protein [Lachnospiraceae bacterium]